MLCSIFSSSASSLARPFLFLSQKLSNQTLTVRGFSSFLRPTMSINLQPHAFAGNPLRSKTPKPGDPTSPDSALEKVRTLLSENTHEGSSPLLKVLPFRKGKPLACSSGGSTNGATPFWHLGWISLADCKKFLENSEIPLSEDSLVYLGSKSEDDDVVYWAIDVSAANGSSVPESGETRFCFAELRTLMVATDWADARAMEELAIAGHARALLEWHSISLFCGHCGERTMPMEGGRRKQCSNESCKKRIYPRVDPVEYMKSTISGSGLSDANITLQLKPGESLEEAVRRETWEETGIEVGEVIYHSSQPWPVGPSSMPCQLMVGFFAYAKSLEIHVDKEELEDAQWHSREDVKKALTYAEYDKAQKTAAIKVDQMCKGVEKGQNFSSDFNVESGELALMFIPGPFAIAHHLISSWVHQDTLVGAEAELRQPSSISNL